MLSLKSLHFRRKLNSALQRKSRAPTRTIRTNLTANDGLSQKGKNPQAAAFLVLLFSYVVYFSWAVYFICVFCRIMCTISVPGAHRNQKMVLDPIAGITVAVGMLLTTEPSLTPFNPQSNPN